jgi:hypothetical protein
MNKNFDLRRYFTVFNYNVRVSTLCSFLFLFSRKIYGDAALGEMNLRMIEIARQVNPTCAIIMATSTLHVDFKKFFANLNQLG